MAADVCGCPARRVVEKSNSTRARPNDVVVVFLARQRNARSARNGTGRSVKVVSARPITPDVAGHHDARLALLDRLAERVPHGSRLLSSVVSNRSECLYPAEQRSIERAVDKRRHEFSTGRWLARAGLRDLGFPDQPILAGGAREPLWPPGVVGSITHSAAVCAVLFGLSRDYRSVGIDLELSQLSHEGFAAMLLTPEERPGIRSMDELRLVFSAKEAVYKAAYPLCRTFLDFQDVVIRLDRSSRTFRAVARNEAAAAAGLERGQGLFEIDNGGTATLFAIEEGANRS